MLRRLRFLRRSRQLREEMEAHISIAADQLQADGLSRREAEFAARKRFGSVAWHAEESRSVWISRWVDDLAQDLRYTLRTIGRDPGFALVATLSAALAIGACTTIFAIANFALLRTLPVEDPARLISITLGLSNRGEGGNPLSYPQITELREQAASLSGIAASAQFLPGTITAGSESGSYWGSLVTANFFQVVRPRFLLGTGFNPQVDDDPGAPATIVLSHALWRSQFGADPNIIGKSIAFNKQKATVVGVVAPGFRGTELAFVDDFWIPLSMRAEHPRNVGMRFTNRNSRWLQTVARLAPGSTLQQARNEAAVLAARYATPDEPSSYELETAGKVNPGLRKLAATFFALAMAVTLIILLIACANVANLLLARGESRQKEIGTRLALGATRGRLIRQSLAESTVLALLGGIPGIMLAYWGVQAVGSFRLPMPMPLDLTIQFDQRVYLFCFALCLLTGVLFGLIPAIRSSRIYLDGRRAGWTRRSLVVLQIAASLLLLIGSGLFLRSLGASQNADLGFDDRNTLIVNFEPGRIGDRRTIDQTFLRTLISETEALPGVLSVAITDTVPLSVGGSNTEVEHPGTKTNRVRVNVYRVTAGYFPTLGIPFRSGATFRNEDQVVIINRTLADRMFPGRDAEGESLNYDGSILRIIGVVENSKSRFVHEDDTACVFLPMLTGSAETPARYGLTLLVRTADTPLTFAGPVREVFRTLDRTVVPRTVATLQQHVRDALFLPRLGALLFGLCGGIGLLIASIGVYGVISFGVARRTREIGIRMALGAQRTQVVRMILGEGLRMAIIGVVIGLAGGFGFGKVARGLLYGVSGSDPATFLAVPLILLLVAAVASFLPARRAARAEPMAALRIE